ncbi:hypothetical protein HanXRQr2_Chr12g0529431 [Helianthus annuus]|uniref:Uncharacterized protein n=1 Tax=Helianthus annuus TaxID=4232 RepID=A0A9K3EQ64_HELAN|nr:hypothetical protein HanXRQr2_Chr12g0529431 [Helianthus annuus]KAJ0861741.1 hypothetical protein HanPSC8_Chr12g0510091 [Helianthus annuus]
MTLNPSTITLKLKVNKSGRSSIRILFQPESIIEILFDSLNTGADLVNRLGEIRKVPTKPSHILTYKISTMLKTIQNKCTKNPNVTPICVTSSAPNGVTSSALNQSNTEEQKIYNFRI